MFGNGSDYDSRNRAVGSAPLEELEELPEAVLLESMAATTDRRVAALEMATGLVVNRETGEDAVEITRIADVFLAWLEQDSE
jgi:hypothetical protein